jgi:transposase
MANAGVRGRPIAPLVLSAQERSYLERQVRRHRVARWLSERCRVILRCADGLASKDVAAELGLHEHTVGKWRRRFLKDRCDGLLDEARPGRPRTIDDDQVAAVIERTLRTIPIDATHWSIRSMTHRKLLQSKAIAIENDLRGTLRNFGLKVGMIGTVRFEARIKELVENLADLAILVEPLLVVRRVLREQLAVLHRRLLAIVREDDVCRRLMTIPGVGPVVALTYRVTVDVPARFRNSKAVGAVFGLPCSKYHSGEINRTGKISKCGDEMMRMMYQ